MAFGGRSFKDGQVKIRGFRVKLTEVEEVIRRFDGIRGATVAAFDEPGGGHISVLDFHYILSDGASEAILLEDISRAYAGEALGKESYTGFEAAMDEEEELRGFRVEADEVGKAFRSGLRGRIVRVGNLMGRHSDGEFRINFNTNAF